MNDLNKNIVMWVVIALVLVAVFSKFNVPTAQSTGMSYSDFIKRVDNKGVKEVEISGQTITGQSTSGEKFQTYAPYNDPKLVDELIVNDVKINVKEPEGRSVLVDILVNTIPFLLIIGLWIYIMRQMQGGGGKGGPMSFGKSKARMMTEDQVKVTFNDVAGCEEAKEEVFEIVEFLRDPSKFQKLGGKIPRGVLLAGSPGTGKTLLAKAIAGEAKVPFFSISGSDFVEMFVGVGASRVRDMFEQAKKHAPCIIFIDEIDAVGRKRGSGMGGGNDEREQTLNQLLVEMDGFEGTEGVIVVAATNRPDVLDEALLRPGRFDRQVVVPLPDVRGREQILKVHMRKVPLGEDVKPAILARGTPGFSGADLANLVNEAALFSARGDKRVVSMEEFEKAKDKIMMGAERKSMVMNEKEKSNTAYHEAGHAIVGLIVPDHDPVYKVTIIPRGRALGVTMFLPEEDKYSASKQNLESQISTLFGGRIAEEMILGKEGVTTGASNDIERATSIARNMVTKWGLSEKLGPLSYSDDENQGFMGAPTKSVSDDTAHEIDDEVRKIIDTNYVRAETILKENIDKLDAMAKALIKYETIDQEQIAAIMKGDVPPPPEGWTDDDSPIDGDDGGSAVEADSSKDDKKSKKDVIGDPAESL
ncbi:ATP-dependent zinc metalloprotease FtsH [Cocleimonas flava]|uniref:ATP-dependent zinc metalloprotease FtsH n=2 Tax=Cocleimonas flava TaxID=634765 RepID=A0A4V2P963_9GAMM|nr:cell division protease FtsH [Cocleimonas flava]